MTESPIERATYSDVHSDVPTIHAGSRVDRVVVHAGGAVISRVIELPDEVPDGIVDLVVRGVSLLAEAGSMKVVGAGADHVVSVQTDLHIPEDSSDAGPSVEKVKVLDAEIATLRDQKKNIDDRVGKWRALRIAPTSNKLLSLHGLKKRVNTALQLSEFIDVRLSDLDKRSAELFADIRKLEKDRAAAVLEDMQASSAQRMGLSHPSTEVRVRTSTLATSDLAIEYVVPYGAMWWPVYTLRLTESGRQAELAIEAFVAQRTSEDWTNAEMAFATSDLLFDVRLPKLLSLRLGRSQPPPPSGYRPPPKGVSRLFESFDSSFQEPVPTSRAAPAMATQQMAAYDVDDYYDRDDGWDEDDYEEEITDLREISEPAPEMMSRSMAKGRPSILGAAANLVADGVAKLESTRKHMQPMDAPMAPQSLSMAPPAQAPAPGFGAGGAPPMKRAKRKGGRRDEPEMNYGLGDDWLNFDRLVLASPTEHDRGQLRQAPRGSAGHSADIMAARSQAAVFGLTDPSISRGMFDYRYEADGRLDVPSDGMLHRVSLTVAKGSSKTEFRAVPQRDPAVYRESILENPHDTPLLDGQVDVFLDGQFVSQTATSFVGSGGTLRIGLGEEDRVKVSRNARVSEESAGLLGGKREITHTVDIELRSGLPFEAKVELLDRIPVTDDDDIDIKFVSSDPPASDYDQLDRELKIRGGKKWLVSLDPGDKRTVTFQYAIKIKDKEELVGGNRREP